MQTIIKNFRTVVLGLALFFVVLCSSVHSEETGTSLHYAGTVIDEQNQPIADATVIFDYRRKQAFQQKPLPQTKSAKDGTFEFEFPKSVFEGSEGPEPWLLGRIVAIKNGYGFADARCGKFEKNAKPRADWPTDWTHTDFHFNQRKTLLLNKDDVPIVGQLVDKDGKPVVDALITTRSVGYGYYNSLDSWAKAYTPESLAKDGIGSIHFQGLRYVDGPYGAVFRGLPQSSYVQDVHSDSDGRFTIHGVGHERVARLAVIHPNFETACFFARTRAGEIVKVPNSYEKKQPVEEIHIFPNEFKIQLGATIPLVGQITNRFTGEPVAGCEIIPSFAKPTNGFLRDYQRPSRTISDKDGHYKVTGLPITKITFGLYPSAESGYLPDLFQVTLTPDQPNMTYNKKLTPGVIVKGRVTDKESGKPVYGHVQYYAAESNSMTQRGHWPTHANNSYFFDEDGRYSIAVLPGKGLLTFQSEEQVDYVKGEIRGAISIPTFEKSKQTYYRTQPELNSANYELTTEVNPSRETKVLDLDVQLFPKKKTP